MASGDGPASDPAFLEGAHRGYDVPDALAAQPQRARA
jgi:hypothetical protein